MTWIPFGRRFREIGRLGHVLSILTKHGFGWLVVSLHLDRFVPFRNRLLKRREKVTEETAPTIAARIASVLQELGPTYVKLGQVLCSRQDLLPPPFIQEFRRLQDKVRPFPNDEARRVIEKELGRPIGELFETFGPEPFAAGSIAQAYKARTADGRAVVVKVRRPGVRETLESDIDILSRLAELAERYVPEYRVFRPALLVEEFAQTVRREVDFIAEASNTERFRQAFEDDEHVLVPHVLWSLTASAVLTLEHLEGIPIYDEDAMDRAGVDRKALASRLTECFIRQYFEMGLFHADPHHGNLVVQAPDRVGILDFGQVGRLSDVMRSRLGTALIAALYREFDIVLDVLDDLGSLPDGLDDARFMADLAGLVDKYSGIPLKRLDVRNLFEELIATARRHRVILPRDFVLLGKSLVTMGGVALELDPDTSLVEVVRPKVRSMAAEKISPKRLAERGLRSAYHVAAIAEQGPRQLRELARKLTRGRLQIQFRHENLDRFISELDRSTNRVAFAMIVAAIILGSAVIMGANVGPKVPYTANVPVLGLLGFLVAGVLGVWLAFAILR
ncbi:MAG: AarF/ABC1/UbiB kinase family protein, partial [Planctomycetota bacterium]|nr:AarF/ABC1/UbiB kinase family protein [Planctomycetota bacterium]